jgi:Co/Zn/Cd efflux system component
VPVLPTPGQARHDLLARRIRLFVAATIAYNVVESAVALTAGVRASSTALVGFGLDSLVEVSSAAAVAWQFAGRDHREREQVAMRVIALSFFGLAAFVVADALRSLLGDGEAQHSSVGLVLAAVSLVVMPLLSYGQRRTGRELGSRSAVADSRQTLICTYLSAVLLVGLALNSLLGWSWADPVAGLGIAALAVREGVLTWQGRGCCLPSAADRTAATGTTAAGASTGEAGAGDCGCAAGCAGPCCGGAALVARTVSSVAARATSARDTSPAGTAPERR